MNADMEQSFKLGMEHFGHLIHGFDRKDAILSGMETRTSSPLRIKEMNPLRAISQGYTLAEREQAMQEALHLRQSTA